jgi:hypothetical protein
MRQRRRRRTRQLRYFLSHDSERERIAQAGRAALLSRHTYDLRAREMIETVVAGRDARTAKARSMTAPELRAAYGRVYRTLRLVDAAFPEFDTAWRAKSGRRVAGRALARAILRRLNVTVQLTKLFRSK